MKQLSSTYIEQVIDRHGIDVVIKRRTLDGMDDYNKPIYTWATEATEKGFVEDLKGDTTWVQSGKYEEGDVRVFLKAGSTVLKDDRLEFESKRFEIRTIDTLKTFGSDHHLEVMCRRLQKD